MPIQKRLYNSLIYKQIIRMGSCCWNRKKCNDQDSQSQANVPARRYQRIDNGQTIKKPIILFYDFQGPFKCQIITKTPQQFVCFPKPQTKNAICWEGEIKNNKICIGNHSYPYLFWETQTAFSPNLKPQFRFNKEDMSKGVFQLLLDLGLSEKQATNFVTFWIHVWQQQSSWLIHVLAQQTVNRLYPLEISPKPSEIKRIYLLFGKDETNSALQPLKLTKWEITKPKTVVQWGAAQYDFNLTQ